MYRSIILSGLMMIFAASATAAELVPWPPEAKTEAVEACKQSARDSVAQAYLTMTNEDELPPDFFDNAASSLQPIFDSCDCAISKLQKQIGFDYYSTHEALMPAKIRGLAMNACAPKPVQESETGTDSASATSEPSQPSAPAAQTTPALPPAGE